VSKRSLRTRKATKNDLGIVEKWLRAEFEEKDEGFYCNWPVIKNAFKNKDLIVLSSDDEIVGFVTTAAKGADIIEIRPDARGKGYGARLAEWAIDAAYKRGNCVFEGECSPESSIPFWQKMGLTISRDRRGCGGGKYAYKVLEHRFLLGDGPLAPFVIGFYPEKRNWDKFTEPFLTCSGKGELLKDNSLQLPTRAICFVPEIGDLADCVVRVVVNDTLLFEGKVKYREAKALGMSIDPGGIYFLERILLKTE
jgi:GNAT superfamily N-acetyltransferase